MRTMRRFPSLFFAFMCVFLTIALVGGESVDAEIPDETMWGIVDFREIPGVTVEEIDAIERLQDQKTSFVYGALVSTETFQNRDGAICGFSALFCEWLSELFEIPFEPVFYEWGDLITGLENREVDFTGELTANKERRDIYLMTDAIAERLVKCVRIEDSEPLSDIAEKRTLRYAFLEGTVTVNEVTLLERKPFEPFLVDDYDTAYDLLKSGQIDAFFEESSAEAAFDVYSDVVFEDFFPLIYGPVSLTTQNPDYTPIISVVQKALHNNGTRHLTELYNRGEKEYIRNKLFSRLSDEEIAYLEANPHIPVAAESDNYPISFYDTYAKEWQGIFFDVLYEIELLTGLTFYVMNAEDAEPVDLLDKVENGQAAVISELTPTLDRESRFLLLDRDIYSDRYALLSKAEHRNISVNEVLYIKVGLIQDSTSSILFKRWFPSHANTVQYRNHRSALDALESGEVEMVMTTQNQLLVLTNYRELVGYKTNILFDYPFESTMGFNKDEIILCSIIEKTLHMIDTKQIAGHWMRKTYDYRNKVIASRQPWLAGTVALLLCVLLLLLFLFRQNRNEGRRLEKLVEIRTSDLNQQHLLMHIVNEAAALLLKADPGEYIIALKQSMEMIGRFVDADRINVWRNHRKDDNKLYYKQIYMWVREEQYKFSEDLSIELCYGESLPRWEKMLSQGTVVNGSVSDMPEEERPILSAYKLKSFLVVPLFLKGEFWGFVTFDDCHRLRKFPESDVYILRSWGLLVIGAIQRDEIAMDMRRTLTKLETVIKNYRGIIWSVDENGIITTFNGQYLKTIGVTPAFLEGKKLEIAKDKNRHFDVIEKVEETFHNGPQDWLGEVDGGVFQFYTSPMIDEKGRVIGVMGSTDDVSGMIKLHRDLETAVIAAEAASRAKSEFLANMSHEIRTPMNAIIGMTTIGKAAAETKRKDYAFDKIDGASKHLLGVINDILDMSKIEASKFDLSPTEFEFGKMLQQVVNVINFRVEEKSQSLTVHVDKNIPESLIGDDQRIAQVITNLIGNAVKFTQEGGSIELDARLAGIENDDCCIRVAVSDNGIGISAEQQSKLFRSFQQAETNTARKFGGTGLGLSISKSIVEMMDGAIWVESQVDEGSTFTFSIKVKVNRNKKQERALGASETD